MRGKVALCVDEAACCAPEAIGLDGERLDAQSWLDVYSDGESARASIASDEQTDEAWVVSCADVEPINLAAALKSDSPRMRVCLVSQEVHESLLNRAQTALIDEVIAQPAFVDRYGKEKSERGRKGNRNGVEDDAAPEAPVSHDARKPTLQSDRVPGKPAGDDGDFESGLANGPAQASLALKGGLLSPPAEAQRARGRVVDVSVGSAVPESPLPVPQAVHDACFVMPVVSGSGGAGKSVVSVMSALISRDYGNRTLLLDYDLQFGDVSVLAGSRDALSVDEAIEHPERLDATVAGGAPLVVLGAPPRLEMAEAIVNELPRLLQRLAPSFDVLIANTGAAWAEQHAVLLERSSAALFLIDQRASSVRACKHALELCARCGIASNPFLFAVNRCAKGAPLTAMDVSAALEGAVVYEIKDGGRDVEDYLGGGGAEDLLRSGNEFCTSLQQMLGTLLPNAAARTSSNAVRSGGKSPFKRRGRHVGGKRGRKS